SSASSPRTHSISISSTAARRCLASAASSASTGSPNGPVSTTAGPPGFSANGWLTRDSLPDEHLGRGLSRKVQDGLWEYAEYHSSRHAERDRDRGGRPGHHDRPVRVRFAEEHHDDHADVEERRDGGGDDGDDDQRGRALLDGRLEHGELPGEPAGERDAGERQQEEGEHSGDDRGALAETRPPGQVPGLAARVPHHRDDGERADRREAVGEQVEQGARQ